MQEKKIDSFKFISNIQNMYKDNPEELFFRIVSALLSMLILPHIVLLFFAVYMSQHNFFSYDFFTDGIFGMKLFFLMTVITLFVMSLSLTSGIIAFIRVKEKICTHKNVLAIYIVNILMISILLGMSFLIKGKWGLAFYLLVISIILNLHLASLLYFNAKRQFGTFIFLLFSITFISISFAKETSHLLSLGLKSFGTGGEIRTTLYLDSNSDQNQIEKGNLLLISPKSIYLKSIDTNNTMIFPIHHILKVQLHKN